MNQEKVGKIIKKIRIENNLTQEKFAEELGVTYQAVSKWENGKSLPDISLIKEICNKYNIDINSFLDGDNVKNKKNIKLIIIFLIMFFILIVFLILLNHNDSNFEFKQISSSCSSFTLNGTAAYNKNKTSLSISDIDFCGDENDIIYDSLDCKLYEENGVKKNIISSCNSGKDKSLESYIKSIKINVNNYNSMCKNFSDANMYIEINAKGGSKTDIYKIPLKLKNNC